MRVGRSGSSRGPPRFRDVSEKKETSLPDLNLRCIASPRRIGQVEYLLEVGITFENPHYSGSANSDLPDFPHRHILRDNDHRGASDHLGERGRGHLRCCLDWMQRPCECKSQRPA